MKRLDEHELLDEGHWPAKEVEGALRAIRRVNWMYGGDRTHKQLFFRVATQQPGSGLEILEVASGRGEVVLAAARALHKKKIPVRVSLLDQHANHLPQPEHWDPFLGRPEVITGNALQIPLENRSVDIVSCCLFFHHLGPGEARRFLREALRVARIAVIINDLERTRLHYLLSHLHSWTDPSRLSRHDGPVSVRRAYSFGELHGLLRETGRRFELRRSYLYRLGAIVWHT